MNDQQAINHLNKLIRTKEKFGQYRVHIYISNNPNALPIATMKALYNVVVCSSKREADFCNSRAKK